jgi:hypothetical protein
MRVKLLLVALTFGLAVEASASDLSPAGVQLAQRYDAMDVEHRWLPGTHVNWRSGEPDNGKPDKTHCSAFLAAAAERLGVYILRPPDHTQVHLANAQYEWLSNEGKAQGWRAVDSPFEAQRLANAGVLVVAFYANPNPDKPGHAALIRPSEKRDSLIRSEGPQITQAGTQNARSTSLEEGFRHHPGAWHSASDYKVAFFAHGP